MCTSESDISKKSRTWLFKCEIEFWRVYFCFCPACCSQPRSQLNPGIGRVMLYNQCKNLGFWGDCELIPVVAQGELHQRSRLSHFSASRSLSSFPSDIFFFSHWDIIETNLQHLNIPSRVPFVKSFYSFHSVPIQRWAHVYLHTPRTLLLPTLRSEDRAINHPQILLPCARRLRQPAQPISQGRWDARRQESLAPWPGTGALSSFPPLIAE